VAAPAEPGSRRAGVWRASCPRARSTRMGTRCRRYSAEAWTSVAGSVSSPQPAAASTSASASRVPASPSGARRARRARSATGPSLMRTPEAAAVGSSEAGSGDADDREVASAPRSARPR
jgi:hypothetical protein